MSDNGKFFPFDFFQFPVTTDFQQQGDSPKEPFIEKVEEALRTDLQDYTSFGCKICNCHTHAGSKIHFADFTEAELLFHNNYYNNGFAQLSYQYILRILDKLIPKEQPESKQDITHVLLIGYENYSELFLQALKQTLRDHLSGELTRIKEREIQEIKIDYCVYEVYSKIKADSQIQGSRITRLASEESSKENGKEVKTGKFRFVVGDGAAKTEFDCEHTMCVFIVPINTTLSTMDKMIAKFHEEIQKRLDLAPQERLPYLTQKYICLITLYDSATNSMNTFWEFSDRENNHGSLKAGNKFEYLNGAEVCNFVALGIKSYETAQCRLCFPDLDEKSLTPEDKIKEFLKETPMFGVNRGSVVPMLQIGVKKYGEPIRYRERDSRNPKKWIYFHEDSKEDVLPGNCKRVWRLSNYLEYKHIVRGGNHFQYYFHTDMFLDNELVLLKKGESKSEIVRWLVDTVQDRIHGNSKKKREILEERQKENESSKSNQLEEVFDYLIAPRHSTNSLFVHIVNEYVFGNQARIIYLDVDKEFRENLEAKYSDFTGALTNLNGSGMKYRIRFHFVDDSIYSGSSFLRAKNLLSSLTKGIGIEGESLGKKELFSSAIILINRMSEKTREFYVPPIEDELYDSEMSSNESQEHLETIDGELHKTDESTKENIAVGKAGELLIGKRRKKRKARFFYYVDIRLSSMRSFEDACTLCKLAFDFRTIENDCATNKLAWGCERIIKAHEPITLMDKNESSVSASSVSSEQEGKSERKDAKIFQKRILEKRYLFFISYLLEERLKGKTWLERAPEWIDGERTEEPLKDVIRSYYELQNKTIRETLEDFLADDPLDLTVWQIAFIKAITRPFFTFHIRKRQAAFAFCIEELNRLLSWPPKAECSPEEVIKSMKIQTLVKGLADLNANFILRNTILAELVEATNWSDQYKEQLKSLSNYETKRLFTRDSLLMSIKKNLVLSRDSTKSLLLEYILLTGKEDGFFEENKTQGSEDEGEAGGVDTENLLLSNELELIDGHNQVTIYGSIYLENNSILNHILCDKGNRTKLIESLTDELSAPRMFQRGNLYFFENFKKLWELNVGKGSFSKSKSILEKYNAIIAELEVFAHPVPESHAQRKDFSESINEFLRELLNTEEIGQKKMQAIAFFHREEDLKQLDEYGVPNLFSFFTVAGHPQQSEDFDYYIIEKTSAAKIGQAFYHDENIVQLTKAIIGSYEHRVNQNNFDVQIIKNVFEPSEKNSSSAVIRYGLSNSPLDHNLGDGKIPIVDDAIYLQLWGFDKTNRIHLFALKLLLTLRRHFVEILHDINLQEIMESRHAEMKYLAMSIGKAATHAAGDTYYDLNFIVKGKNRNTAFPANVLNAGVPGKMYDLYLQLLADERISSIYRQLIRGDNPVFHALPDFYGIEMEGNFKRLAAFFGSSDLTLKNFEYVLHRKNKGRDTSCRITFNRISNPNDDALFPLLSRQVHEKCEIIWITLLMAINCMEHSSQERLEDYSSYIMNVEIANNYIKFSNPYFRAGTPQEVRDKLGKEVNRAIKIPPFVFEESQQNLTLWTLNHMRYPKGLQSGGFTCEVYLSDESEIQSMVVDAGHVTQGMFNVEFKFFDSSKIKAERM